MSDTPVALVTGGGTGIGAACCRALASEGFRVAVHYRSSEEKARKLAAELADAFTVQADLGDAEQIEALIGELKEKAGRVDVLVNNAGFNVNAPMLSMKLEDFEAVTSVARGTSRSSCCAASCCAGRAEGSSTCRAWSATPETRGRSPIR